MIAEAPTQLGIGLYTPSEAAFYARVHTQTMSRWIHGNAQGQSVVHAELYGDTDKTVTFNDFVQALAIRAIRTQYPIVSIQKIRNAVEAAREERGIIFPLAVPHKTFVITHGSNRGEIVLDIDGLLIQVSGRKKDQILIGPIAELYLDQITFDELGRPEEYRAWSDPSGSIVMNPHRRFGEPIVDSCGYTAQTLWEASITEGGIDAAADAYGVNRTDVALACTYYDHLMSVAA